MTYEEFRRDLTRYSKNEECILLIDKKPLSVNDTGLFSSVFDEEGYKGCVTWRRIEKLIDENRWQNYPLEKKTVMDVDGKGYVIEVYFLTDVN